MIKNTIVQEKYFFKKFKRKPYKDPENKFAYSFI